MGEWGGTGGKTLDGLVKTPFRRLNSPWRTAMAIGVMTGKTNGRGRRQMMMMR